MSYEVVPSLGFKSQAARGPLKIGAATDPFAQLQSLTGALETQFPGVASLTREIQTSLPRISILTSDTGTPLGLAALRKVLSDRANLAKVLGRAEGFFVLRSDGRSMLLNCKGTQGNVSAISTGIEHSHAINYNLHSFRTIYDAPRRKHYDSFQELLQLPDQVTILEQRAAHNHARWLGLQEAAEKVGGNLICNGVIPESQIWANRHVPNIPYVAIPDFSEFTTYGFSDIANQKPLVVTGQDLFSKMSVQEIDSVLQGASKIGAVRCMFTQFLPVSSTAQFVDPSFYSDGSDFRLNQQGYFLHKAVSNIDSYSAFHQLNPGASGALLSDFSQVAYESVMQEYLRFYLKDFAAAKTNFTSFQVVMHDNTEDLTKSDGLELLENSPELEKFKYFFEQGLFNQLTITPYGYFVERLPEFEEGLRVRHVGYSFVFSKEGYELDPGVFKSNNSLRANDELCVPAELRTHNILTTQCNLHGSMLIDASVGDGIISAVCELSADLGMDFALEVLPQIAALTTKSGPWAGPFAPINLHPKPQELIERVERLFK